MCIRDRDNIGEDDLKINVKVTLRGANPKSFFRTVKVPSKRSKSLSFSATAGTGNSINITAIATSDNIQESDQVTIRILHLPKPHKPSQILTPSPTPSLQPSQTETPSMPPVSTQTPSSNLNPSESPSPSTTPKPTPSLEEERPETVKTTPGLIKETPSIVVMLAAVSVLVLFSFLRRIWKVEEP